MFQNIAILEAWGKIKRKFCLIDAILLLGKNKRNFYLIDAELNRKTREYKRVCTHYNILRTIIR